jgi:Brp/Blh family beta-carotene 15,15'-monooxygenase
MLAVMVYTLPALVAFAVYFCLIHTIRHMYRVMMMLRHMLALRMAVGLTMIFTLASWAGGAMVYMALLPSQGAMPASMMVVFIGLAALTVPHSLLIDSLFRPRFEYDAQEQNTSHNPIEGRHV